MLQFVGVNELFNRFWWAARLLIWGGIVLILCISVIKYFNFRINQTNSMPKGLYHFNYNLDIKDGSTVLIGQDTSNPVYMTGVARGYDPYNMDLIKKVIGVEGDSVKVLNNTVYVHQKHSDKTYKLPCLDHDNKGRKLGCTTFSGVIPKGNYFVFGESSTSSFDSRYFGMIQQKNIKGDGGLLWGW